MSDDDSFEERIKAIAREVGRSVERMSQMDMDELAEAIGVDPARARELAESAERWFNERAESLGEGASFWEVLGRRGEPAPPARSTGPHPLDLPTEEQGLALSALDSGRWTVEPGSNVLHTTGEGPSPHDALGLVGELRARDWIAADGAVTLVGRDALARWLASDKEQRGQSPGPP
ncbi:MAG TPA: hypothetical protein VGH45_12955 [Solirubrobacteraceae bacterium]